MRRIPLQRVFDWSQSCQQCPSNRKRRNRQTDPCSRHYLSNLWMAWRVAELMLIGRLQETRENETISYFSLAPTTVNAFVKLNLISQTILAFEITPSQISYRSKQPMKF